MFPGYGERLLVNLRLDRTSKTVETLELPQFRDTTDHVVFVVEK